MDLHGSMFLDEKDHIGVGVGVEGETWPYTLHFKSLSIHLTESQYLKLLDELRPKLKPLPAPAPVPETTTEEMFA